MPANAFVTGAPRPRVRSRRVAAVAAATFVACAAFVEAAPFDQGRLFRVSRPGSADSYVFGTIHIADPRIAAIPQAAQDALARSRLLAMELVPDTVLEETVQDQETLADGARLAPLIGAEAYAELRAALAADNLPASVVERLKPWAALLKVSRQAPPEGATSLDVQLYAAARSRRMQVTSLELLDEQVAAFDTVPLESQVALLRHALAHRDAVAATIAPTVDAWLRGDLAGLASVDRRIDAQYPGMGRHYRELTRHLIDGRTAVMHHRLHLPLRSGRVFVAVGASHLPGNRGLLALLRRDGYRVDRIW